MAYIQDAPYTPAQPQDQWGRDIQGTAAPAVAAATGTSNTLQPSATIDYNPNSQLYNWQLQENLRKLRQGMAARGNLTAGTGAQIESQMQAGLAAGEADKQYNRTLDLVKLGMGQGASAGQWVTQGINALGQNYTGLGNGLSGLYGTLGQDQAGLLTGAGNAAYGTGQNMGTIQGKLPVANSGLYGGVLY